MPTAYRETGGGVLSQQSDNTSLNLKKKKKKKKKITDNELLCSAVLCFWFAVGQQTRASGRQNNNDQ